MVLKPSCCEPRRADLADAQMKPTGRGARNAHALRCPSNREAARLVEIGGDLGEELVRRQADRDRDADLVLDAPREARKRAAGLMPVQTARCR